MKPSSVMNDCEDVRIAKSSSEIWKLGVSLTSGDSNVVLDCYYKGIISSITMFAVCV